MDDLDGPIAATLTDDEDLGRTILEAICSPASQASDAFIQKTDIRDVLIDGHFDFVVIARLLRAELDKELRKWISEGAKKAP